MFFGVNFSSRRKTEIYVYLESVSEKSHRHTGQLTPETNGCC